MARTFVQQSQVSGSLEISDSFTAASALTRAEGTNSTLVSDLNDLRKQLNRIIGEGSWAAALAGEQDLSDIYAAVHMDGSEATFQGNITGSAGLDLQGAAHLESTLLVDGAATFGSDASIMGNADVDGTLIVGGVADFAADVFAGAALGVSGTLDVAQAASLASTLSVDGVADFAADVYAAAAMGISGTLDVAQAASLASTLAVDGVADFGADVYMAAALGVSGTLAVAQKADFAGIVDVATTLSASEIKIDGDAIGHIYLVGSDGEIQDSASLRYEGATLFVSGAMEVENGLNVLGGGLTVAGDRLEVTGSFGLLGDAAIDGDLSAVSGSFSADLDVNGDFSAKKISIDGDTAQRLYIVDANGSIKDEEKLTFDGSELWINGDLEVAGGDIAMSNGVSFASSAANKLVISASDVVEMDGDLKVGGNTIKSSTADALELSGADVEVKGDLKVSGNDIKASDDSIAITLSGADVSVKGDLTVEGNEIKSTTATVLELSGDDAYFKSDVHVAGKLFVEQDFVVKGTLTEIDTTNLRVEDAFIYLATGSLGTTDSGIVLHGGAGAGVDLVMGQDGGAGEFIFGKGNRAPDGDGAMDGIELVSAWMSGLKVGDHEGSLSGSFAATAAGAELSSESALTVVAADSLALGANGEEIDLMSAAEKTDFDGKFDATSVVGALVELFDMIGGGSAAKGDLTMAAVAGNTLTFGPAIGTLTAAEHKLVDVYLNGVLLSPSRDLSNLTTTTVDLDSVIASGLVADDVITVVIRSAA